MREWIDADQIAPVFACYHRHNSHLHALSNADLSVTDSGLVKATVIKSRARLQTEAYTFSDGKLSVLTKEAKAKAEAEGMFELKTDEKKARERVVLPMFRERKKVEVEPEAEEEEEEEDLDDDLDL